MNFDKSEIKKGDIVHDVVMGAGVVDHVNEAEQNFSVKYGQRQYTYNAAGVGHFPIKTVYWQDPVAGYTPMKDDAKWAQFCAFRKAIAQVIWSL
jgi:hypothetical protein